MSNVEHEPRGVCDRRSYDKHITATHEGQIPHFQLQTCVNWREQPQGEATRQVLKPLHPIGESQAAQDDREEAKERSAAQSEGGEKPLEIFVGPPDRLETAMDIMGVDPLSQGTFACDICGKDVPHSHEPAEVETERYIRPAFKKTTVPRQAWAQLEAHGPYLEPLTDQLWKHFESGWEAAKRHYQIGEPSSPPATAGTARELTPKEFLDKWWAEYGQQIFDLMSDKITHRDADIERLQAEVEQLQSDAFEVDLELTEAKEARERAEKALRELIHGVGKVASDAGEKWRLSHVELMDAYESALASSEGKRK